MCKNKLESEVLIMARLLNVKVNFQRLIIYCNWRRTGYKNRQPTERPARSSCLTRQARRTHNQGGCHTCGGYSPAARHIATRACFTLGAGGVFGGCAHLASPIQPSRSSLWLQSVGMSCRLARALHTVAFWIASSSGDRGKRKAPL